MGWESGRGRYVVEPNEQGGTEKTHKDAADGEMRFDRTGMAFREGLGRVDSQRCDPKASGTKGYKVEEKICGREMRLGHLRDDDDGGAKKRG